MRVLTRYLLLSFLATFGLALLVFTFVMYVVAFMHAVDLLSQGVPVRVLLRIIGFNIPFLLSSTLPVSALTASLLVFGRLSVDGEITALKASGLSLWQIAAPVLLFGVLLSGFCFWMNFYAAPNSHYARRTAKMNFVDINPLLLLEEGRFNYDFPGIQIYAGQIRPDAGGGGANLRDVILNEMGPEGLRRNVKAADGRMEIDKAGMRVNMELHGVSIEDHDPADPLNPRILPAETYLFNPSYESMLSHRVVTKSQKDFTLPELLRAARDPGLVFPKSSGKVTAREKMKSMLEFHSRVASAAACFSFILLGIPLGLRNRRRDSSSGITISLGIMLMFYLCMAVGESLEGHPALFPDLILWIPVIASQSLGFVLLRRAA